jgi:hypothetical protein
MEGENLKLKALISALDGNEWSPHIRVHFSLGKSLNYPVNNKLGPRDFWMWLQSLSKF